MERFSEIWRHPLYQEQFWLLQEAEQERIFCSHTLSHFLDVARLMYLYTLTERTDLTQDLIYAAALLHDIGRYQQILDGTPHEKAGAALAARILPECGYTPEETADVCQAILGHRSKRLPDTDIPADTAGIGNPAAAGTQQRTVSAAAFPPEAQIPDVPFLRKEMPVSSENFTRGELLARYLRRADKKSRRCFCCSAAKECNWPKEKRNAFPEL